VLPTGLWQSRNFIAGAVLCAVLAGARAQTLEELPLPSSAQELPLPDAEPALEPEESEPLPGAEPLVDSAKVEGGIGNADIQEMVAAEFSDPTIIAVIRANSVAFDLSPRALVALKSAGVSEQVIEAMLAAEEEEQRAAEPEPTAAQLAETQASVDPAPRAYLVQRADRVALAPTIAQVAFAGGTGRRGDRMKNLQGLAGQALAFANPAVSGIATTLGSLFRPDEERTAVWALAATQSARVLDVPPVFEVDFAHIPGVDPDRYQPAIVQLVPTNDNYRLVAAAETDGSNTGALPRGPIIEENVPTESTRLGRGQYRVAPKGQLGPGEYALVLRPIPENGRRRRNSETSLGELLGGSTSQILYLTWDFSIPS
jgi:hypothetical protein